ncbi:MAG: hypothetical protein K2Y27_10605 [Xanthobacteraceae bacterium]|nr:hypothetical protein [Xanthobacteraceae bacterium]
MAQLPDENVVALPQLGSRRPVSSIDVSGYARGAAAIGTGVEALGKGITSAVNDLAAVLNAQREYARANATLNAAAIKRGNEIEKATDPAGLPEKVATLGEDTEIAVRQIKDPRARELLMLAAREQGARLAGIAATRASHLAREASKAQDVATLNALTEGAIQSSDPTAVPMAMQSASDVIDGWTWMDRREADTAKALFAQDFAVRRFDALPLAERQAAFAGNGRYAELVAAMPDGTRKQKRAATQREFDQARAKASYDAFDVTRQALDDAANGLVPLPAWEGIANDPDLQPADRDRVRALYDTASAEAGSVGRFMTRLWDWDAGPFDPSDPEERKNADKAFALLGRDALALQTVVPRTRILPARAAMQLHSSMMSDDPKRVKDALTISANLYSAYPNIFIGSDGQSEFESNAVAFRHYVDTLGMTADEAAARIIRDRSPEHQARVQVRLKAEDVDGRIRRRLSVGDLAGEFSQVSWSEPFDPNVGFDPATHKELFDHYTELVKDRYLETGDFALAKIQAADQLKRIWGVTRVNGSQTVMPYPPERAPAYDGIENAADLIAAHAVETIKTGTGQDVPRSSIRLMPVPGVTATQYKSGQTPSYLLTWADKRGNTQMLLDGKAFQAPPDALRAAQDEARQRDLERRDEAFDAAQSNAAAVVWGGS